MEEKIESNITKELVDRMRLWLLQQTDPIYKNYVVKKEDKQKDLQEQATA